MNILFITNLYPPSYVGGYELRCSETADEMIRRGHNIFVLTSREDQGNPTKTGNIFRYLFFNPMGRSGYSSFSDPLKLRKRYYQISGYFEGRKNYKITHDLINILKPEIIFVWGTSYISITPVLASQECKIPVVFSIGDYSLLDLKNDLSDRSDFLRKRYREFITGLREFHQLDTTHLLLNSNSLKEVYVKGGFPEKDIFVIPRGIHSRLVLTNSQLFNVSNRDTNVFKFLFVGRIVPEKAPDIAIAAINYLRINYNVENMQLDIAGDGQDKYIEELRNLVQTYGLEGKVRFLGHLKHSEVLTLYPGYCALLFPSRWNEPFSGTILEAMARGLPIVASMRGGTLEIIQDGVNGLLVPAEDPESLAAALYKLINNKEFSARLRLAGLETIRREYTLEKVSDKILSYFKDVLERNR